jgi:2-polyprenyl-3-methyl-5-hydroxy-6-metoxy-1,4-benzoquinol methylase
LPNINCGIIECAKLPLNSLRGFEIKILITIASHGLKQDKYVEVLVDGYRKMAHETTIVVLSNVKKPVPLGVELIVGLPTNDPWSLPFAHKKVLAERVEEFDLFIYSENDTMVLEPGIDAFLRISEVLPENEIPGFLRYENSTRGVRNIISSHGHYHWDPASVVARGPYIFAFHTNEHAAFYLLKQKQLRKAIESGGFLRPPYRGKYDLACTAATDPYTICGLRKLICISHLDDFILHHLPDKYTDSGFTVEDQCFGKQVEALLGFGKTGMQPDSLIESETKLPDAWYSKDFYEPARQEILAEIPADVRSVLSVGSGSGKAEKSLMLEGKHVTAIPLDPVIGVCLEGTGVDLVHGGFDSARKALQGQAFDCIFISNILHLVPEPAKVLSSLCELLRPGGHVLLVTPNVATLKNSLNKLMGKAAFKDIGNFESGGAQNVSAKIVEEWLRAANCSISRLKWKASPRFERIMQLAPGLFDSLFGSEIIALGRKAG